MCSFSPFTSPFLFQHSNPLDYVSDLCWVLVKGIGYLHKFCIAHRDITENLVVDRNFCLENINFDVAMKVDDKYKMERIEEKSM
jgi:hypothetical protein